MPGAMSRLFARGRAVPWLTLYAAGKWIYGHGRRAWNNLDAGERQKLGELVRKSKGRRANLSKRERDEFSSLVKKAVIGRA